MESLQLSLGNSSSFLTTQVCETWVLKMLADSLMKEKVITEEILERHNLDSAFQSEDLGSLLN